MSILNLLVFAALIATIVTLGMGLRSMSIGGDYDLEHSEKFMWERVGLQALVIILLIATIIIGNT